MFAVDDIDTTVAALRAHGAELVGEVAQYQDSYRLGNVRGPEGDHRRVGRAAQLTARRGRSATDTERSAWMDRERQREE
jgi:hypothetical protein